MNTGAKIAIGCTGAVLLAGLAVAVAVGGAFWFVKDQVQDFAAGQERIQALEEEADRTPFVRPDGDVIEEERLQAFLEIRRRVFDVYQHHRDLLEPEADQQPDFSAVTGTLSMIGELRLTLAEARAEARMSGDEYAFMVEQVYKSMWAEHLERNMGEEGPAEAARQALETLQEQLREAQQRGDLTEEQQQQLEAQIEGLRESAASAADAMAELEVPAANRELLERYQDEIRKYSMAGLEAVGL